MLLSLRSYLFSALMKEKYRTTSVGIHSESQPQARVQYTDKEPSLALGYEMKFLPKAIATRHPQVLPALVSTVPELSVAALGAPTYCSQHAQSSSTDMSPSRIPKRQGPTCICRPTAQFPRPDFLSSEARLSSELWAHKGKLWVLQGPQNVRHRTSSGQTLLAVTMNFL